MFGFHKIPQEERWIIEWLGRFQRQAGPGLIWTPPFFEEIRGRVSIRELQLPLFEQSMKLDFKNGSATPRNTFGFVKVLKPDQPDRYGETGVYKLTYAIEDWRRAATALLENAVRSYLSSLTIEEGLEMGRLGYNLLEKDSAGHECLPRQEVSIIKRSLSGWGLQLTKITLGDLDLDPALLRAREELFRKQQAEKMAILERGIRTQETSGALVDMLAEAWGITQEEVQSRLNDPALQEWTREEILGLIRRRMAINGDGKGFMEISVPDGTTPEGLIALLGRLLLNPRGLAQEKPEEERTQTRRVMQGGRLVDLEEE